MHEQTILNKRSESKTKIYWMRRSNIQRDFKTGEKWYDGNDSICLGVKTDNQEAQLESYNLKMEDIKNMLEKRQNEVEKMVREA